MKKLLLLLPFGLLLSACSNDFDVTAPWKDIPVVYAILSPQDSAHYVRIEKAFVDPDKSALVIARIADSLYYPENAITVWLVPTDNPSNRLRLERVDGALEGYPRDSGVFATQPNWLYKAKPTAGFTLDGGKTYRLLIERNDNNGPDVTAETTLPNDFLVLEPDLSPQVPKVIFASNLGTDVRWRTDVNGVYFNVTFRIRYYDRFLNGTVAATHELVWEAAKNVERNDVFSGGFYTGKVVIPRASFYSFLAQNIQKPPSNIYREFKNCDIILDGGGREIKEYLQIAAANADITGAETFPNYTNISEGYGIFTAKNRTLAEDLRIDVKTVDSMNVNTVTDTLGFRY
ncbi:MAG: hypothetical protein ACKVUS_05760 [Saprospiraceae bacterium]